MSSDARPVQVVFAPEFKRNLRALAKKYRHIRSDVQPVIEQVEAGEFIGDRIPGTSHVVFKVRVLNRDIPKGKSAGYRLIYQLETPTQAVLVTIYSKLDQTDISSEQIRRILLEFEQLRSQ
jgi:mRNA-degrading endonuclease RelE of RelBE toxin-antitoxin system